ncbi:MAG: hypothetical protein ACP5KH_06140, partial [Thermodesulfovibrio sp.]
YGGKEHAPEEVAYRGHSFYQPFKNLVSFRIGKVQFKGFYPVTTPSIKISVSEKFLKILQPDEWLYYPLANKCVKLFEYVEKIYELTTKKYIAWLILGSIVVMVLLFYISGGKQ